MNATMVAAVAIVGATGAWGAWYLSRAYGLWRRLHGDRIVTCPETGLPAVVQIDVAMAITSKTGNEPLVLDDCSRWRERGPCEQPCVHAACAASSAPVSMVRGWAHGRTCVSCGGDLVEGRSGHHLALYEPGGTSREWVDVAADRLPLALATSLPMCWNCHVAETFRRLHPELVTDRDFGRP